MPRFSCSRCGEEWDRHPATRVPCPDCKRPTDSPCIRPSGHTIPGGDVHVAREKLAVDRGLLQICTASLTRPEQLF